MRICVVSAYCWPHIGGVETVSFEQAIWLARLGHQVTIVSSKTLGEAEDENVHNVRIRRVTAYNILEQRLAVPYPLCDPSSLRILKEEIEPADICIIHGFQFPSSLAAGWFCRMKNVPYVLYQATESVPYRSRVLCAMQRINERFACRLVLDHAAEVLAISRHTRDYVSSLSTREVSVLYGAVDHQRFTPAESRSKSQSSLGLPTSKFIVLTVRRLVPKNSVDTLLATAKILRSDPGILFIVVGDGSDRSRVERYLRAHALNNCALTGWADHEILPSYYRAANLFVLPSKLEALGLVVLEAMATGLPVIATDAGGQAELVQDGWNGFLVPPSAPQRIAELVQVCQGTPGIIEEMGRRGRETVERKYTWDTHVSALLHVLKGAASRRESIS
jgi:glycosyltransferase involved in cell wall biosynthesis